MELRSESRFDFDSQEDMPQGLKPDALGGVFGTAEAVPFQSSDLF
jgi:hypothetical protein